MRYLAAWLLGLVVVFAIWKVGELYVGSRVVPSPTLVLQQLANESQFYRRIALQTGFEASVGLLFAAILSGVVIAIVATLPPSEPLFYPYVVMLKASPAVAFVPLFVSLVGQGPSAKMLTAAMISFFPLLIGGLDGIRSMPEKYEIVASGSGGRRLRVALLVRGPFAMLGFLSGLKTSAPLSVVGAIVGEYVAGGRPTGIGNHVMTNYANDFPSEVFVGVVLATLLGLVAFGLATVLHSLWLRLTGIAR